MNAIATKPKLSIEETVSIETFVVLVKSGIELWSRAGEMLVALVETNPNVYSEIISRNSFITFDMLLAFERMGRKQIYPPLLMDNSHGAKRLLELPYEMQERYAKEPIEIVAGDTPDAPTQKKYLKELSAYEAAVFFNGAGVRTLEQQREFVKEHKPKGRISKERMRIGDAGTFCLKLTPGGALVAEKVSDKTFVPTVQLFEKDGVQQCVVKLVRKP